MLLRNPHIHNGYGSGERIVETFQTEKQSDTLGKQLYRFNNHKCIAIWYSSDSGFSVAFCHDEPSSGVQHKEFKLQREAIAYVKRNFPNVDLWIEKQTEYVKHFERKE